MDIYELQSKSEREQISWFLERGMTYKRPQKFTFTFNGLASDSHARAHYSTFLAMLNRNVLKQAHIRHGKELRHLTVIEDAGGRHIHSSLELPDGYDETKFRSIVRKLWVNLLNHKHVDFGSDSLPNDNFLKYQLKSATKEMSITESIIY